METTGDWRARRCEVFAAWQDRNSKNSDSVFIITNEKRKMWRTTKKRLSINGNDFSAGWVQSGFMFLVRTFQDQVIEFYWRRHTIPLTQTNCMVVSILHPGFRFLSLAELVRWKRRLPVAVQVLHRWKLRQLVLVLQILLEWLPAVLG